MIWPLVWWPTTSSPPWLNSIDMSIANDRRLAPRLLLLLILLSGFGLRVASLDATSLWLDELIQVFLASRPRPEFLRTMFDHVNLPVDLLLSRAMLAAGAQDGWLRLAPAFAGVLSLPLIYAIARRLAPPPAPAISMALLAFSPLAVQYSRDVRPYSLLLMLTLASILFFLHTLRRPRQWPGFVAAATLALHTHLFAVALLPALAVAAAVWGGRPRRSGERRWAQWQPLILVMAVGVIYLLSPFLPDYIGGISATLFSDLLGGAPASFSEAPAANTWPGWAAVAARLPDDLIGRFRPVPTRWLLRWCGLALALLGVWLARRRRLTLILLLAWLFLVPAPILYILAARGHWYSPRYIIQALPALLILAAMGMAAAGGWLAQVAARRRAPIRWSWLAASAIFLIYLGLVTPALIDLFSEPHENIRAAAAYIRQRYRPGDLVVAPVIGRYIDHYLPSTIPVLDTNNPAEVELEGAKYERVFLLISDYGQLTASAPPWLTLDRLLARFYPKIEVYQGPAGAEAAAFAAQRQQALRAAWAEKGDIPPAALRQRAAEARAIGDWQLTISFLQALLAQQPQDAALWVDLGFALHMSQAYTEAIAAYTEAIRLAPRHAWAHLLMANSYRLLAKPEQGLVFAQRAVALAPNLSGAWSALGNIQHVLGQPAAAVPSFARAIELDGQDLNAWYGYARAATAVGLPDGPDAWLRVLTLNPPPSVLIEACQFLEPGEHPACFSVPSSRLSHHHL